MSADLFERMRIAMMIFNKTIPEESVTFRCRVAAFLKKMMWLSV